MGIHDSRTIPHRQPQPHSMMPEERLTMEVSPSATQSDEERALPWYRASRWRRSDHQPLAVTEPAGEPAAEGGIGLSQPPQDTAAASYYDRTLDPCQGSGYGNEAKPACCSHKQHISDRDEGPTLPALAYREASCRCAFSCKACRRSRSNSSTRSRPFSICSADETSNRPPEHRIFCSVGVHGLPPQDQPEDNASASARGPPQQQEKKHKPQRQRCCEEPCDAQIGEKGKADARCNICGTFRAKAPSGFFVMRADASLGAFSPNPTGVEGPERGGAPGAPGRLPSCDDCGCLLPAAPRRGVSPYRLMKQQQPRQGEVVAGGVQWGHPTSFWLVESAREEGIEREFRRLFRSNSPESRIALSSYRLLVTLVVVSAALKYGISTYFPPANQIAFICFFCADVLIWSFFFCEAAMRARGMGLKRFCRDRQCVFDSALNVVGLAALLLRACVLINIGGLGTRVFEPNPLERTDGIVNDFTIGDVQIALVALDTVQLARTYRLAFSCRELFFLTRSILHSLRSLLWTALFVLVVIYTCAIFCTWAYYDEDDAEMRLLWGNLVLSMFTLFTVLTLEGWNNVATATAEKHPFSRIFFVAYICFTTLTLLNIVTGIILDAYVDMSNRLLKEANYKDDLEKDMHNEKVLLTAFEKTCFLVCLRPVVTSSLSAKGTAQTPPPLDQALEACGSGNQPVSGWAGGDLMQDCIVPTQLRESDTSNFWHHAAASTNLTALGAASASQSPRLPVSAAGTRFERKLTGVPSEDSTARPSTESATDTEPLRTHMTGPLPQDSIAVHTCIKYLRVGGHQPMDILRHPIVQDALQVARIPFYQAFDVLNMYHRRGIQFVTVKEFAEACGRVAGAATGRQLLQVQLELQQKLCAVERSLRILCRQKQLRHINSTVSKLDSL